MMKTTNLATFLSKIHFLCLGLILLNQFVLFLTGFGLKHNLAYAMNIILYFSGIILCIIYLKPFRFKTLYFSFYALSIMFFGLFYLFGGIFLALVGGTLIKPLYPTMSEFENNQIILYPQYNGFLSVCCPYMVNEKYGIFEKRLGIIMLNDENKPPESTIKLIDKNTLEVSYFDFNHKKRIETLKITR